MNDAQGMYMAGTQRSYIVTVQLRTGEEITRRWTSAEDSTEAVFLTLTSITDEQKEHVSKVDVKEQA